MDGVGSIQLDIPDFRNSVLTHLNSLRVQGRLCDIIVQVEGHSFRAHKVVLAASSPYFRDHMSLSQMSTVSLSVIRNPSVFEQLLSFCYTGRLRLQLCDIISYLTAASFLQMQHIIDRCTQILEGIHLKISLSDLDDDMDDTVATATTGRRSTVVRGGGARCVSPQRSERPRGGGVMEDAGRSPEEEEVGSAGGGGGAGPILRINRAGQWYVETGAMDTVHIKTEDEWLGGRADTQEEAERGRGGGGVAEEEEEEEGPAVLIDTSGRSSVGPKAPQPTSSFPETDSPTGSVVVLTDRQRAKSESPGRLDEHRQPSSQGEEPMPLEVGGYEEYLREQVGGDSRWFRYNPRLTCIYCCKSFNQKGSLDRHMRLHMGITPFVCRICGKKYTRKDQLEYHIRKHTGNKPFHCHMCGKSFPFQAILNQHFRKNHPGCTAPPQQETQAPHSAASPETTTTSSSSAASLNVCSSRGGGAGGGAQNEEVSPSQEEAEPGGGGTTGDTPQASVSTTGPD